MSPAHASFLAAVSTIASAAVIAAPSRRLPSIRCRRIPAAAVSTAATAFSCACGAARALSFDVDTDDLRHPLPSFAEAVCGPVIHIQPAPECLARATIYWSLSRLPVSSGGPSPLGRGLRLLAADTGASTVHSRRHRGSESLRVVVVPRPRQVCLKMRKGQSWKCLSLHILYFYCYHRGGSCGLCEVSFR